VEYPHVLVLEYQRIAERIAAAIQSAIDAVWETADLPPQPQRIGGYVARAQDVEAALERGRTPHGQVRGTWSTPIAGVSLDHNVVGRETGGQLAVRLRSLYPDLTIIMLTGNPLGVRATSDWDARIRIVEKPIGFIDYATIWVEALRSAGKLPPSHPTS
jgi:hypothetical protein